MTRPFRQRPDLEIVAADEGFVVHDANRDIVHYLNQTAAMVLALCDGGRSVEEIAQLIAGQFGLETAPLEDVSEILTKLKDQDLVQ
jgi:hypothetical protein